MKIGFDAKRCFRNTTGLGNYSRHLVDMIASKSDEFELHLFTPKTGHAYPSPPEKAVIHTPSGLWKGPLSSAWRTSQIASEASNSGIDVFHGLSNEIPTQLRKKGIASIVTIHDLIFERYPSYYKRIDRKIYRQKFKYAALEADVVVAISEQTKTDLIDFYHIPESKIEVIYQDCLPVFGSHFSEDTLKATAAKYKLPAEFLLQVGTLEERKNVESTVRALRDISEIPLVLVGRSTPYFESVMAEAKLEGTASRIHHIRVDSMEELAQFYQLASVFIYPSRFEGFGIPIIEALRSKTPVITTHSGVFPEAGGDDSVYVDPESPEEIASAVNLLLSDSTLSQSIAEKGYEFAEKFRTSHLLEEWTSLYHRFKK